MRVLAARVHAGQHTVQGDLLQLDARQQVGQVTGQAASAVSHDRRQFVAHQRQELYSADLYLLNGSIILQLQKELEYKIKRYIINNIDLVENLKYPSK